MTPSGLTIVCDTREHKFVSFPKVMRIYEPSGAVSLLRIRTVVRKLETGDYSADGHIHTLGIERKGSTRELFSNLFSWDYSRFSRAFDRLAALPYRALVLDMPVEDGTGELEVGGKRHPVGRVIDTLFQEAARRCVPILWLPPGRDPLKTGTLLVRWMLSAIRLEKK